MAVNMSRCGTDVPLVHMGERVSLVAVRLVSAGNYYTIIVFLSSTHCWLNTAKLVFYWKHDCVGWLGLHRLS